MDAQTASVETSRELLCIAASAILHAFSRAALSPTLPISAVFDLTGAKPDTCAHPKTCDNS